jgi:hypothetical protein
MLSIYTPARQLPSKAQAATVEDDEVEYMPPTAVGESLGSRTALAPIVADGRCALSAR